MSERQPGPNELRDHLANERTFLAWMRTCLTIIGLGFVVAKFGILIREVSKGHVHSLTARAGAVVGVALVLGGMGVAALASLKFLRTKREIDESIVAFSPSLDILLAIAVVLAGLVLAGYMIVTA
jgi:putative membrane protein